MVDGLKGIGKIKVNDINYVAFVFHVHHRFLEDQILKIAVFAFFVHYPIPGIENLTGWPYQFGSLLFLLSRSPFFWCGFPHRIKNLKLLTQTHFGFG